MLWLYILLGIVLFIALVMFIPITLRASYKEEFWCAVYIGFVKLQLVPAKPKKEKKKKKAKKQTQKTEQPKKATEKKPSLIKKYGIEWLFNLIKKVAELAVSALQDFFSHILVKKLSLSISVAGDDAADTAIKYGKYCAVVYPAVGTIVRVVKCKGYGVDINPNFRKKQKQKLTLTLPQEFSHSDLSVLPLSMELRGLNFLQKLKMIDINIVEKGEWLWNILSAV